MADNPQSVCALVLGLLEDAFNLVEPKMAVTMVAVGGAIVDGCCGGVLMVAPESEFRTSWTAFPLAVVDDDSCQDPMIAFTVLVVANRCLVPVDQKGRAPRQARNDVVYHEVFQDARVIWSTLAGDLILGEDSIGDPLWRRTGLTQTFTANVGGCVGSETRVTLGIPGGLWCAEV